MDTTAGRFPVITISMTGCCFRKTQRHRTRNGAMPLCLFWHSFLVSAGYLPNTVFSHNKNLLVKLFSNFATSSDKFSERFLFSSACTVIAEIAVTSCDISCATFVTTFCRFFNRYRNVIDTFHSYHSLYLSYLLT